MIRSLDDPFKWHTGAVVIESYMYFSSDFIEKTGRSMVRRWGLHRVVLFFLRGRNHSSKSLFNLGYKFKVLAKTNAALASHLGEVLSIIHVPSCFMLLKTEL